MAIVCVLPHGPRQSQFSQKIAIAWPCGGGSSIALTTIFSVMPQKGHLFSFFVLEGILCFHEPRFTDVICQVASKCPFYGQASFYYGQVRVLVSNLVY
jgi:hypothetical protein